MEAIVDELGRIVIPREVRDDLGLSPGSVLRVVEKDRTILLEPVTEDSAGLVWKDGVLVFDGTPEDDLGDAVERDREERIARMAGLK